MVFMVLALVLLGGAVWISRAVSAATEPPPPLPFDDLPPVTAGSDWPRGRRMRVYLDQGFEEIDHWLHHRDEAV